MTLIPLPHSDESLKDDAEFEVVSEMAVGESSDSIVLNNMRKRRISSLKDGDGDHKRPRTQDSLLEV